MTLPATLEVVATEKIFPSMLRVHFGGEGVRHYLAEPLIPNIKLYFPDPDGQLDYPAPRPDGHGYEMSVEQRERVRTYTVRGYDVTNSSLMIDFVLHGSDRGGQPGLASTWAQNARPGDKLGALGGGGRLPAAAPLMFLLADDTGLPAVAAILETLPADQKGEVLLEVQTPADELDLVHPAGMRVRWLHRGEVAPGRSELLAKEAAKLKTAVPADPKGSFWWISAEAKTVRTLRKQVREWGVDRRSQLIIGYWNLGATETDYGRSARHDRSWDESTVVVPAGETLAASTLAQTILGCADPGKNQ